jgi:hypothetical protein
MLYFETCVQAALQLLQLPQVPKQFRTGGLQLPPLHA